MIHRFYKINTKHYRVYIYQFPLIECNSRINPYVPWNNAISSRDYSRYIYSHFIYDVKLILIF